MKNAILEFQDLDRTFFLNFIYYMRGINLDDNITNKILKKVRAVLNDAAIQGVAVNMDFKLSDVKQMRHITLILVISFFNCLEIISQCPTSFTIFTEDFEDHGNTANGGAGRYTSANDFHEGVPGADDDYWGRIRASDLEYFLTNSTSGFSIHSNTVYSGQNGNFYYAGEDLDDIGGSIGSPDGLETKEISFTGINISGASNMCFSGLFARGETDPCSLSTYDHTDYIRVYYEIDGGGEVEALCFHADIECNIPGDVTNEPLHHDPNCDGDGGDGAVLSAVLTEYTFNIAGTGLSLDLRIEVHMDAGSEEVALDFLRIHSDTDVGGMTSCPNIGGIITSDSSICEDEVFDLTATGLDTMAQTENGATNYGIQFKSFSSTTTDPYVGGTSLGIVPFGGLTMGQTEATLMGATISAAGSYDIYAILNPIPGDASCRPSQMTTLTVDAKPTATFTALNDLCMSAGVQIGLTGGMPVQGTEPGDVGTYSGPGVTNNGTSYDFDAIVAGPGDHTLTYTYTDGNGCMGNATDTVEVFVAPEPPVVSDIIVCGGGSTLIMPTGGIPPGPGDAWVEDFEDNGNSVNSGSFRYSSLNDFFRTGTDDDYFGRIEASTLEYFLTNTSSGFTIHSNVIYSGHNGNFFYAAEDLDDLIGGVGNPDGLDYKDLTITNIDISGSTGLSFRGLFAAGENDPCGLSVYDNDDFIEVYYNVDGGGEVLGMCFNADLECNIPGDITNEPLYHDPNCDGDGGEGTLLTATFAEFSFAIPDGNLLNLRIRIHMDGGSEEVAFDYFRLEALNNVGTMYNFYDGDPNMGGSLLAGPVNSYDPGTTPATSPQSVWVTVDNPNCESAAVEVVVTVNPADYSGPNALTGTEDGVADYETDGEIESIQIIGANAIVDYDSGTGILLNPNFTTILGAVFHAFIDGCGGEMAKDNGDKENKN